MKTIIIYESKHHGNTKRVCDRVAAECQVELIEAGSVGADFNWEDYDLVGFASGIASEYLMTAMGTPAEVLTEAVSYLKLYLIGNVALFLYMQFTSIFRAFGDSVFQMKGMLMTVIVNAILDPIMINWWGYDYKKPDQ